MKLLTVPAASPATPLMSLTAVSFDTESTSLDVKSGRILEYGAIALVNGELKHDMTYSTFVDAAVAIPPESSRIHGITADKLKGAPSFAEAHRALRAFAANHLVLGFAIDFDLALLKAEHERAGLAWKPPATLDVRTLVRLLRPTLPDFALETIAHWQGIAIENRHQALGDAVLTAKVYLALVPLLRERNIRTLGEALAACRRLDEQNTSNAFPLSGPLADLARTDSFPYRHRINAVMAVPALRLAGHETLATAMSAMIEKRVSSLFVEPKSGTSEFGILTERDVMRALAAERAKAFTTPVSAFASKPLKTVREDDFIYVAMGLMRRARIRHLGVVDDQGALVGAVSQRDLLRLRADEALALTGALSDAVSVQELAGVWQKLAEAARALLAEDVEARDIAAIISGEVCQLTARAAAMAEAEVEAVTKRPEGLVYAVMVLGSGGRGESLLALDQDNAIVFECPDETAADAWLAQVATRMNAILDAIGVPYCKGGVMARSSSWRMSMSAWKKQVDTWLSRNAPADILNADIFFDSLPVHGARALADDLRNLAIAAASSSPAFLKLMSMSASEGGAAFNWLGRFSLDESGRIDLKRHGIMPVFTAARVSALRFRIHERSTKARLLALRGNPNLPQQTIEALIEAHGLLLSAILTQQLDDLAAGQRLSNAVDPKTLSALERDRLKWALVQVKSVSDVLGVPAA